MWLGVQVTRTSPPALLAVACGGPFFGAAPLSRACSARCTAGSRKARVVQVCGWVCKCVCVWEVHRFPLREPAVR